MNKLKRLSKIQNREIEALKHYQETQDPKYLEVVRDCLEKRADILSKNLPQSEHKLVKVS